MQNVFDSRESGWNQQNVLGVNGFVGIGKHDGYKEPELWVEDWLEDLARRYEAMEMTSIFAPYV